MVDRHGPALHAYLTRRAGPADADDLLAQVWLAAFAARRSFDPARGEVRGWLFGVARHTLAAHLRTRSRAVVASAESVADEWDAVDARLDATTVRPALREALAALPAVERELLLLVTWEELAPAEAATALGIPPGTARSRLHRARQRMREHLGAPPASTG
nr:sigma-70 family RNA polymerase sigma factor [Jiangella mangrovi]